MENREKRFKMILPSSIGGSGGRHLLLLLALLDVLSAKVGIGHGHDHQGKKSCLFLAQNKKTFFSRYKKCKIAFVYIFFSLHSIRIRFTISGGWWNWRAVCRGQLLLIFLLLFSLITYSPFIYYFWRAKQKLTPRVENLLICGILMVFSK